MERLLPGSEVPSEIHGLMQDSDDLDVRLASPVEDQVAIHLQLAVTGPNVVTLLTDVGELAQALNTSVELPKIEVGLHLAPPVERIPPDCFQVLPGARTDPDLRHRRD